MAAENERVKEIQHDTMYQLKCQSRNRMRVDILKLSCSNNAVSVKLCLFLIIRVVADAMAFW